MNIETRSVFGEYTVLLKEWCVAAFCSATLDWIASKIPVRNGIFATLLSIGQLTISFVTTNSMLSLFGGAPGALFYLSDNWLAYNTIIIMSPTAISRLTDSYRKLHFILYGPGRIPQPAACASGNCGTSTITGSDQKALPQREMANEIASELNMQTRIASQYRAMKGSPKQ